MQIAVDFDELRERHYPQFQNRYPAAILLRVAAHTSYNRNRGNSAPISGYRLDYLVDEFPGQFNRLLAGVKSTTTVIAKSR